MKQYLELLQKIVDHGYAHEDRTGVGRISIIGEQLRFNLSAGFPLVTSRKIFTKALIEEMLWFIRGCTDTKELVAKGVNIWNHWALQKEHVQAFKDKYVGEGKSVPGYEEVTQEQHNQILDNIPEEIYGNIGPMYGYVWRNSLTGIDQLAQLIKNLKERPYSSRHVVTAWLPEYIPDETMSPQDNIILERGALAPCHMMFQCFVSKPKGDEKPKLSLMMTQR